MKLPLPFAVQFFASRTFRKVLWGSCVHCATSYLKWCLPKWMSWEYRCSVSFACQHIQPFFPESILHYNHNNIYYLQRISKRNYEPCIRKQTVICYLSFVPLLQPQFLHFPPIMVNVFTIGQSTAQHPLSSQVTSYSDTTHYHLSSPSGRTSVLQFPI